MEITRPGSEVSPTWTVTLTAAELADAGGTSYTVESVPCPPLYTTFYSTEPTIAFADAGGAIDPRLLLWTVGTRSDPARWFNNEDLLLSGISVEQLLPVRPVASGDRFKVTLSYAAGFDTLLAGSVTLIIYTVRMGGAL
jgi:hypothetical protein